MPLFVYVCPKCEEEAQTHSFAQTLEAFRDRVEKSQDTGFFDPFPPPYLVKKQFGRRQGRLVAERHTLTVNEELHTVIVFLGVMIRGERAYDSEFGQDPEKYGQKAFAGRFTEADLMSYVSNRLVSDPVHPKPTATDSEYGFLYNVSGGHVPSRDGVVYETDEWVKRIQGERIKPYLVRIYDTLSGCSIAARNGNEGRIRVDKGDGLVLLAKYNPEAQAWFLIAPLVSSEVSEAERLIQKYAPLCFPVGQVTEEMLRLCRRAYPELILGDQQMWQRLEEDSLGNLALSPEETEILEYALSGKGAFPLFINGRAGSGKSTILQYLFTDFLLYHLTASLSGSPPAYFTCNSELLRRAKEVVQSLLECSSRRSEFPSTPQIPFNSFREYYEFIRDLLPEAERTSRFSLDRRVTYARFRRLWQEKFGKEKKALRDYGPDMSWHVIRTYIKGATVDCYLEPEEYRQLDLKQRTVSQDIYEKVYKNVWSAWYEGLTVGGDHWDDQDLVRHALDKELVRPTFPVVFCDEAQDFSRIELDVLLRLSLFSDRSLAPRDVPHVPFVFSGDPFQTLNPSGFRWDAVKAWFAEKFIFTLDPTRASGLTDLNYRELNFNYRSSSSIVRFGNFVQALRCRLFDLRGVEPQRPWDPAHAAPVMLFMSGDGAFWDRVTEVQDLVFIVPCLEGEELAYVEADPVLSKRIPIVDGVPSRTVLSSSKAKGLEFPRVVAYGFGDSCDPEMLSPILADSAQPISQEARLTREYYLNRVYVAVSRARKQLIIVDSSNGVTQLWKFAQDPGIEDKILTSLKVRNPDWGGEVARLERGRADQLDSSKPMDVLANAEQIAREGRALRDSYLLRQAGLAYQNIEKRSESLICRAEADELDGKWLTAGQAWSEAGRLENSLSCFWRHGREGWKLILPLHDLDPSLAGKVEFAFADFVVGSREWSHGLVALRKASERATADPSSFVAAREAWCDAVTVLLEQALKRFGQQSNLPELKEIHALIHRLAEVGIESKTLNVLRAEMAFKAGAFLEARSLFEAAGKVGDPSYLRAKAESEVYPKRLVELKALSEKDYPEKWKRIVQEFRQHPNDTLNPLESEAAGEALVEDGAFEDALPHFARAGSIRTLEQAILSVRKRGNAATAEKLHKLLALKAVELEDWQKVIECFGHDRLSLVLARGLARSKGLPGLLGTQHQKRISEFLQKTFISPGVGRLSDDYVIDIGSAIERAGNRIDSLQFYENVARAESFADQVRRQADLRWIACKERQSDFDLRRGEEKQGRERKREAEERRDRIGVTKDIQLPDYPELSDFASVVEDLISSLDKTRQDATAGASRPKIRPSPNILAQAAAIPSRSDVTCGDTRLTFYRAVGRLNIEDQKTGRTLNCKDGGRICEGDYEVAPPGTDGWSQVADSRFSLRFVSTSSGVRIAVRFSDLGTTIEFEGGRQ